MINQVSGGLNHPPGTAGRAEAAALAGKSDEMLVSTAVAFDPQKAMFQTTTGKVIVKLLSNESRQLSALL